MDQDYEIFIAAGLRTTLHPPSTRPKTVLLLYDCLALPIPDLASKLIDLGHSVVLPVTAVHELLPRLPNLYLYPTQTPFQRPSSQILRGILDFNQRRTGKRKFFTIIILNPPSAQAVRALFHQLNDWTGLSYNLVSEAHRTSPTETWMECHDRYQGQLGRWRNSSDWFDHQLVALNGIQNISCTDVPGPLVDRAADVRRNLRRHLLRESMLSRPSAIAYLGSRTNILMGRQVGDARLLSSDRLFLRFIIDSDIRPGGLTVEEVIRCFRWRRR